MVNELWDSEEFEDCVARSIIGMYETGLWKECKKVPKFIKPTEKDILAVRKFGCYFPPNDRIMVEGELDVINDGFPREACWSLKRNDYKETSDITGEYFRHAYMRQMHQPPPGVLTRQGLKYFGNHKIYKLIYFSATEHKGVHIQKSYVSIDPDGNIHDCYGRRRDGVLQILASGTGVDTNLSTDVGWGSAILGFYADRRFLWNVEANEGDVKANFGVYPEEVKSLFYARELPMTETGRKRPILHWVSAHRRRLKAGIDIDVNKHLRGINEFVYQGTKFTITKPIKETRGN